MMAEKHGRAGGERLIHQLEPLAYERQVIHGPLAAWRTTQQQEPMADEKNQPRPNQLNIEISEEVADGIYSNLAIITHSNSEFVLDFVRVMPGVPKAKVRRASCSPPSTPSA
jgi:hypothetical protein